MLLQAVTAKSQTTELGNNPSHGRFYSIRGIKLYVEQYGNGKPLVLLHGNGGSISSMAAIIPYFAERYHVIAVDSRAHGKSTDESDSLSFEMMADDIAALLDTLKLDAANIIGWSDGGIVSLELAMRHPQKVKKLVSTGANLWPDSTALMPDFWREEQQTFEKGKNKILTNKAEKNAWKLFLLDWYQPNIALAQLQTIAAPALIVSGDKDLIRLEHTILIYQNIPKGQLWV
ncbi:MAG: hypothetical protein RLY16_475, partial [Bacteroidota bacterium]